ncbi:MAG: hypothetical protein ACI9H8_002253 [Lysobacterales bacterium]|jgi:hypothetical protein
MKTWIVCLALLGFTTFDASALEEMDKIDEKGTFHADFRWRLEQVDEELNGKNAAAAPLRTRLNYFTSERSGFSLFVEYDYISDFGLDNYNEGGGNTADRAPYPVVADPSGGDLNQAFVQYKNMSGTQLQLGRQRIIFDNARFIGNVGWRQNEQTYDAVSINHKIETGLDFKYAYIDNVNRIFGDDVAAGDHDQSTHLLNISNDLGDSGRLTGYWYDIENKDAPSLSNISLGFRFNSKAKAKSKLAYNFEFSRQSEGSNNPIPFEANYWRADVSAAFRTATIYAGFESLEGSSDRPGQAFRTPLATLHAFNGWADKFLATPAAGLQDIFIGLKGKHGTWSWNALYHDFSAEDGNQDFGSEIDFSASRKFAEKYGFLLKAASFHGDSLIYQDTSKFWLQITTSF